MCMYFMVTFNKHHVVLLDGYPRRENRALNFRFFVVLPHEAIPIDKKTKDKPLLNQFILSDIVKTQISELSHGLGWQILSHEKYPRFDGMTTFMNLYLFPICIAIFLCMLLLAYWSTRITSGSLLYSGGGWMVSGSTGGKNAALRRTLEIIAEQKSRFDAHRHSTASNAIVPQKIIVFKSNARLQASAAPPRSLATSSAVENYAMAQRAAPLTRQRSDVVSTNTNKSPRSFTSTGQGQPHHAHSNNNRSESTSISTSTSGRKTSTATTSSAPAPANNSQLIASGTAVGGSKQPSMGTAVGGSKQPSMGTPASRPPSEVASNFRERLESMDIVPELIVMHTCNESVETADMCGGRKVSIQGHRRHSRRFSVSDEFKRKKSAFGNPPAARPKRWKAGSLMFSRFSLRRPK